MFYFIVANFTVFAEAFEVAEIIGEVVAVCRNIKVVVGKDRFRWAYLLKTFEDFFRWPPIEKVLSLLLLFCTKIKSYMSFFFIKQNHHSKTGLWMREATRPCV